MAGLITGPASPFFIVADLSQSTHYYIEQLGFTLRLSEPEEDPFFAIVSRDNLQLCLKVVADNIPGQPNHVIHEWARWDVYVFVAEPAILAADFESRGTPLHQPLKQTEDGLFGFEIRDPDGYTLFFGSPV